MDRRDFLRFTGIASTSIMYPMLAPPAHAQAATADKWRTFEVTTQVEVLKPSGVTRVWIPTPLSLEAPFHRTNACNSVPPSPNRTRPHQVISIQRRSVHDVTRG